ncbi:hypothetical protein BaRGS_00013222 [Batillaria attramentaria]|uniref:Uncharacterized protein n=1 Tax=Batillaria attramentaria TaxID=370345 RepID=A0ABD0L7E2_9CAEN
MGQVQLRPREANPALLASRGLSPLAALRQQRAKAERGGGLERQRASVDTFATRCVFLLAAEEALRPGFTSNHVCNRSFFNPTFTVLKLKQTSVFARTGRFANERTATSEQTSSEAPDVVSRDCSPAGKKNSPKLDLSVVQLKGFTFDKVVPIKSAAPVSFGQPVNGNCLPASQEDKQGLARCNSRRAHAGLSPTLATLLSSVLLARKGRQARGDTFAGDSPWPLGGSLREGECANLVRD